MRHYTGNQNVWHLVLIHISLLIKPGNVYQNKLISNESKQYCWSFNSPFD
uniref:Uncharacterized protein n=1 Tax=Anguilla anguilla TaxID=7936 RepID=A0A0E9XRD2_ANGAN